MCGASAGPSTRGTMRPFDGLPNLWEFRWFTRDEEQNGHISVIPTSTSGSGALRKGNSFA